MTLKLIMLAGMPRSGTTWLGKIFDSHPATLYRHEPDSVNPIGGLPHFADANADTADRYRQAIRDFVAALPDMRLTKVTATLPLFAKTYYSYRHLLLRRIAVRAGKIISRFVGEVPIPEVVDYRGMPDLPVVWKSVESVGRLGVLCRAIEHCRTVLILRHPCACIASTLRGEADGHFESSTSAHADYGIFSMLLKTKQAQRYGLTLFALKSMSPVQRLTWRWVIYNERAMDDITRARGCRYVRYEDVCEDPISYSRALFEFTGLSWNEQTETFIRRSITSDRSGYYSIFKNPLSSAYRWRNELAAADIRQVLSVLKNTNLGGLYG